MLALADALLGEKDLALKVVSTLTLCRVLRIRWSDMHIEEHIAIIQTMVGETSRAISTLTRLLGTPYIGGFYTQRPLRQRFLGSIHSGILYAPIPLSKNSARKRSRKVAEPSTQLKPR